jgi:hypothetical protein
MRQVQMQPLLLPLLLQLQQATLFNHLPAMPRYRRQMLVVEQARRALTGHPRAGASARVMAAVVASVLRSVLHLKPHPRVFAHRCRARVPCVRHWMLHW